MTSTERETMEIPGVRYHRPDGHREDGKWTVPYTPETERNIKRMTELGIEITCEFIPGGLINVCLDDGTFDYKFELFPNTPELADKLGKLVHDFDEEDYRRRREQNDAIESGEL